jgi:hypothetical protein
MDQEIRHIYSKLYDSYPVSASDVAWVRDALREEFSVFMREKKLRIREDAKYFLLVNFAEMIAGPLTERVERDRLIHDLRHDTRLLLESASLNGKNKEEISGHDVINALSKNWTELDVMKLGLWG